MTTAPAPTPDAVPGVSLRTRFTDNPALILIFVYAGLWLTTDIVNRVQSDHGYFSLNALSDNLRIAAILGLFAAGQTLVMLTGGIDLSITTTAAAAATIISRYGDHGALTAVALAVLVGVLIGTVNGIGIAVFRVNALIMTLGVSTITAGVLSVEAQGQFTQLVPHEVRTLGGGRFLTYIPYDLLVWVPVSVLIILGLRYSGIGRMIYAVGDNPVASRLAGVRVWQVQLFVYVACATLAAVAGIVLVGNNNAADQGIATLYLLPSVAAVVIGGTSIFGGFGGYGGTILGALILTLLNSLLTILNASESVRQILYGLIVLSLAAIYARSTASSR